MELREKLITAINSEVDEMQNLGAENIADRILLDVPEIETGFERGVIYALARLVEMYNLGTVAESILNESGVDVKKATEYDVEFLRRGIIGLPKGTE